MRVKECRECGSQFEESVDQRRPRVFCGSGCKSTWHNRRRVRGAMLYDLFMSTRYQREHAVSAGATSMMSQLAAAFLAEDAVERNGRRSWHLADAVLAAEHWMVRQGDGVE